MMRNAFRPSQARRALRGMVMECMPAAVLQSPPLTSHTLVVPAGTHAGEHTIIGNVAAIAAWVAALENNDTISFLTGKLAIASVERDAALVDLSFLKDRNDLLEADAEIQALNAMTGQADKAELEKVKAELYASEELAAKLENDLDKAINDVAEANAAIERQNGVIARLTGERDRARNGDDAMILLSENDRLKKALESATTEKSSVATGLAVAPAVAPADANPRPLAGKPASVGERHALSDPTATIAKNILELSRNGFSIEEVTRRINARLSPDQWLKVAVVEIIRELAEASI